MLLLHALGVTQIIFSTCSLMLSVDRFVVYLPLECRLTIQQIQPRFVKLQNAFSVMGTVVPAVAFSPPSAAHFVQLMTMCLGGYCSLNTNVHCTCKVFALKYFCSGNYIYNFMPLSYLNSPSCSKTKSEAVKEIGSMLTASAVGKRSQEVLFVFVALDMKLSLGEMSVLYVVC